MCAHAASARRRRSGGCTGAAARPFLLARTAGTGPAATANLCRGSLPLPAAHLIDTVFAGRPLTHECVSAALRVESQRANLPTLHEPGRPDRKGIGRAGWRCRRRSASAGSACGPGKTARWRGFRWLPSCPPSLLACLPRHPRQGHGCPTARLCRDRAIDAADVGRWLEHRPDVRTARTRHRPRPPLVPAARSRTCPQPGPSGMRHRPAEPDDRRVAAAPAPGRWQRTDAVSDHPAPLHPATRTWPLYRRGRHLRFHLSDEPEPSPDTGDLLREMDCDPIAIFWDNPSRLKRPHSART